MKNFKLASCCVMNKNEDNAVSSFAASELKKYIEKITGAEMSCDGGDTISVGICSEKLSIEGFSIKSCDCCGNISITGGGERGVLYGVYTFLEKYAGCRFLASGVEVIPKDSELSIEFPIDYSESPIMEYRDLHWTCSFEPDWAAKNMLNSMISRPLDEKRGGGISYGGFVHTIGPLTGTYPSVGEGHNGQPCLSDPEMLTKAIASVRKILADNPDVNIVSVSQNDNYDYCKCEKCAAVDIEEGSHIGTLIRFVNAVADDIKDDYPNVAIDTLAYQYTRSAPKITKPRDNVIIRLCTIECCFSHPLDECTQENQYRQTDLTWKPVIEDLKDWGKICNRIYVWDYTTNYAFFLSPFPNFGVLRQNVRFFAENNVRGVFEQGNMCAVSGEFGELRAYLLAKLLRNPYMSEADYINHAEDFLKGYYGKGWTYIADYLRLIHNISKNVHFIIYDHPLKMIPDVSMETIAEINKMWDSAEALAKDEAELDRIRRSRLCVRYFESQVLDRDLQLRLVQLRLKLIEDGAEKDAMKEKISAHNRALYDDVKRFGILSIREGAKIKEADDIDFADVPDSWNYR